MSLKGKNIGDILLEAYGPITGKNYNIERIAVPAPPTITIEIIGGTGSVDLYTSTTGKMMAKDLNPYTRDWEADPTTWVLASANISTSTIVNLPVGIDASFYRIVVNTVGNGDLLARVFNPR